MWVQHNRFLVIFLITGLLIGSVSLQNISADITPPFSQLSDAAMSVALDFFGSGQVTTVRGITENQYGVPDENGNISTEILSMSLTGPDQFGGDITVQIGQLFENPSGPQLAATVGNTRADCQNDGDCFYDVFAQVCKGGVCYQNVVPLRVNQIAGNGLPQIGTWWSSESACVGMQDVTSPFFPNSPDVVKICVAAGRVGTADDALQELKNEVNAVKQGSIHFDPVSESFFGLVNTVMVRDPDTGEVLTTTIRELLDPVHGLKEIKNEIIEIVDHTSVEDPTTGITHDTVRGISSFDPVTGAFVTDAINELTDPNHGLTEIKKEVARIEDNTMHFDPVNGDTISVIEAVIDIDPSDGEVFTTAIDEITDDLHGLLAIKNIVSNLKGLIEIGPNSLPEIKREVALIEGQVVNPVPSIPLYLRVEGIDTFTQGIDTTTKAIFQLLNNPSIGLFEIKTEVQDIQNIVTNIGPTITNINNFVNNISNTVNNIFLLLAPLDQSTVPVDTCAFAKEPDEPLDMSIASTHKVFRTKIVEKENFFCNFEGDPIAREIAIIIQIEENKRGVPKSSTIDVVQCDKHLDTLQIVCTTYQPASSINPVQSCSPGASFVAMDSGEIMFGEPPKVKVTTIIVEKEVISCVTDIANNPTHIYDTFILEEMINTEPLRYQTFVCEKDELTAQVLGCIQTPSQDIP